MHLKPVLVYFHGGAFMFGSGTWCIHTVQLHVPFNISPGTVYSTFHEFCGVDVFSLLKGRGGWGGEGA